MYFSKTNKFQFLSWNDWLNLSTQVQINIKWLNIFTSNRPAYGLYEKVIEMEKWFHEERKDISALLNTNTPLVIVGHEGSGRTTLLYQWMEFHEGKSQFFTHPVISHNLLLISLYSLTKTLTCCTLWTALTSRIHTTQWSTDLSIKWGYGHLIKCSSNQIYRQNLTWIRELKCRMTRLGLSSQGGLSWLTSKRT